MFSIFSQWISNKHFGPQNGSEFLSMSLVYLKWLCRFSDGLKTLGVLKKIKLHPEAFRSVMCYSPGTLTAEIMEDLFDIRWSEVESNNRADESRVVAYWRDYLQDAEGE